MPTSSFGLLLVEGGDEEAVCRTLAGPAWGHLCCWNAQGRQNLFGQAVLARNDANFRFAHSVGVVLDAENDVEEARGLATAALLQLDFNGSLEMFVVPDNASVGAIETLCRRAVRDHALARCVDQLVDCAGKPHSGRSNTRAVEDKGWLRAYLGMLDQPDLRFHQALGHPQGIDPNHAAFDSLRDFVRRLSQT